jgi:cell division septal protein FtsQ
MSKIIAYIILFLILLITYKSGIFTFPIDEVKIISSDKNHNENKLDRLISSLYGNDLLLIDIDIIQKKIMSDDQIRYAEIKKSFPSTLEIKIFHHQPIAQYGNKILTSNGSLIDQVKDRNRFPVIIDHSNDATFAGDIYMFSTEQLDLIRLNIDKIEIYHSLIRIYTDSLVLISDRSNFKKNIKRLILSFDEIHRVYGKKVTSIDMRYSNGFAIK